MNIEKTHAASNPAGGGAAFKTTEPARPAGQPAAPRAEPATPRAEPAGAYRSGMNNPTQSAVRVRMGIDPVVGWLVCIKGPNRGRDYRLHSDRNLVGRAPNMDICIESDETISRENHCQFVFSPRTRMFTLVPGISRNLTYLNGQDALFASELEPYDTNDLGEGSFMFVPFCNDRFDWETAEAQEKAAREANDSKGR
jgi:hypothetical protein